MTKTRTERVLRTAAWNSHLSIGLVLVPDGLTFWSSGLGLATTLIVACAGTGVARWVEARWVSAKFQSTLPGTVWFLALCAGSSGSLILGELGYGAVYHAISVAFVVGVYPYHLYQCFQGFQELFPPQ